MPAASRTPAPEQSPALIESMSYGVIPLVPNRMAFPEHFEKSELASKLLYKGDSEISPLLKSLINQEDLAEISSLCQKTSHQYLWTHLKESYLESFKVN